MVDNSLKDIYFILNEMYADAESGTDKSKKSFNFPTETCDVKILQKKTDKMSKQSTYKILVKTNKRAEPLEISVSDYTLSNAKPYGFDYVFHERFPQPYLDEFKNANEGDIIKDFPFWVIGSSYNDAADRIDFARQDAEEGYSDDDANDRKSQSSAETEDDYYAWNAYHRSGDDEHSEQTYRDWEKSEKDRKHRKRYRNSPPPPKSPESLPPKTPIEELKKIMNELQITYPTSLDRDSMKKIHRKIISTIHPDKFQNGADKKRAHDKFVNYMNDVWEKIPNHLKESSDIFYMIYQKIILE
jgi:hypothetical protein